VPQPAEFQTQRSSVEGLDEAAETFFKNEAAKTAAKRKSMGLPEGEEEPPIVLPPDPPTDERLARALGEDTPEPDPDKAPAVEDPPREPIEDEDAEAPVSDEDPEGLELPGEAEDAAITLETPIAMPDGSEVTLHELRRGFLRETDYTAKTMELAEQRKLFEGKVGEAHTAYEQRIAMATGLAEQLQASLAQFGPTQQQMDHLRTTDPGEYAARIEDMRRKQALVQQAVQAKKDVETEAARLWDEQRAARVPIERQALAEAIPAFKKNFNGEYDQLSRYALASDGGELRPEEWDALDDHRHVTLVWKAREYDKATRKTLPAARKRLAGKPRSIRSGTQSVAGDTANDELKVAMANLKANPESKQAQQDAFMARDRAKRAKQPAARRRT